MELRSGEALMGFDRDLRVVVWNDAARELTGVSAGDAIGRDCWEILSAPSPTGEHICHAGCSYARNACDGWEVPTHEIHVKTAAGRRPVLVSTVSMRNSETAVVLNLLREAGNGAGRVPAGDAQAPTLTRRQRQVLEKLAEGVPAKVIARQLGLTEITVRNHIRGVLTALGAHSQLEAVARARQLGLLAA
jgi:DNA-binding CsgD family transcriptional regulator